MYEFHESQKFSNSRVFNFENRCNLWISCKSRIYAFLKYLSLRAVQERTNVQKKERYQINWVSTKWIFFSSFYKNHAQNFCLSLKVLKILHVLDSAKTFTDSRVFEFTILPQNCKSKYVQGKIRYIEGNEIISILCTK